MILLAFTVQARAQSPTDRARQVCGTRTDYVVAFEENDCKDPHCQFSIDRLERREDDARVVRPEVRDIKWPWSAVSAEIGHRYPPCEDDEIRSVALCRIENYVRIGFYDRAYKVGNQNSSRPYYGKDHTVVSLKPGAANRAICIRTFHENRDSANYSIDFRNADRSDWKKVDGKVSLIVFRPR